MNDRTSQNADTDSFGVTVSHELSKRTDVYGVLVRFNNNANGQLSPGGAGYLGGFTRSAGVDSTAVALGLRHRY